MTFYLKELDITSAFTATPDKHPQVKIIARSEDPLLIRMLLRNLRTQWPGPEHVTWIDDFAGWQ